MSTIWKFELQLTDVQSIEMPAGAEVLSFGNQHEKPVIWARVDPLALKVRHRFAIVGTGRPAPEAGQGRFIGTAQFHGGSLVWHLFDGGDPDGRD